MSPKHRPAEMVSKVEFALEMRRSGRSCRQVIASGIRVGNCALRFAFALPAGKNHARREIVRHEAIDVPETRRRDPHAASSRLAHATWGEHECTSPERRALVALAPGTVKHNSYRPADASISARCSCFSLEVFRVFSRYSGAIPAGSSGLRTPG
jgi:hypothetical protein